MGEDHQAHMDKTHVHNSAIPDWRLPGLPPPTLLLIPLPPIFCLVRETEIRTAFTRRGLLGENQKCIPFT